MPNMIKNKQIGFGENFKKEILNSCLFFAVEISQVLFFFLTFISSIEKKKNKISLWLRSGYLQELNDKTLETVQL